MEKIHCTYKHFMLFFTSILFLSLFLSLSLYISLLSYTQHIFVCTFETFIFFCYHRFNAEPNLPLVKCYLLILTHPFVSIEVNSFRIFCAFHLSVNIPKRIFSLLYKSHFIVYQALPFTMLSMV